ncbi:PD-(D/E)XK nuclease family protein [Peptoniphilus asaccharolyticus]
MKKVIFSSFGDVNNFVENQVLDAIKSGGKVTYVLPTKNAAYQYREKYVRQLGGISNLDFVGLDSIRKKSTNKKVLDRSLKKYVIKRILNSGDFKFLNSNNGMANSISTIVTLGRESLVGSEVFKNSKKDFLREIGEVYQKYESFLSKSKYTDLADVTNLKSDMGLVIFDGFYSVKKADIRFIDSVAKFNDVIFNVPYLLKDINYANKLVDNLEKIGFEIFKDNAERTVNDVLDFLKNEHRLNFSDVKHDEEGIKLFKFIKKDLIEGKRPDVISLSDVKKIRQMASFEKIKLNYIANKGVELKIVEEFKSLVNYTLEQNRTNLLRRLDLKYFRVEGSNEKINSEILKIDFKNLDELVKNTQTEISSEIELKPFFETLESLKVSINSKDIFANYSNLFSNLLDKAVDAIEEFYVVLGDYEIYKNDISALNAIHSILDKLIEYGEYFSEVSLKEYTDILLEYLDKISIEDNDPFKSKVFTLDGSLKYKFDNLYITSFDENFPKYRSDNFIVETEYEFLKEIGFELDNEDEIYQRELLKLLIALNSANKTIIFRDEENVSAYNSILNLDSISENRVSTMTELFSKSILEVKGGNDLGYLEMYQSKNDIEEILNRIFEERLRILLGNKVTLSGNAKEILKLKIDNRGFKVSDLDSWVRSPYSFLYLELVGLKDFVEDPDQTNMEIGIDFHKILERYFKQCDSLDLNRLNEIVESVAQNRELPKLRKEIYSAMLSEYIKADLENRDGFKPKYFEHPFVIKIGKIELKGRIDRVDENFEGNVIITDYKLSNAYGFNKQGMEVFQIPIYMSFFEGKCVEGKYGVIKKSEVSHVIRNAEKLGKIKGASNQLSTEEFDAKLADALNNALSIIYFMYDGIFDDWDDVDSRIKDLARS